MTFNPLDTLPSQVSHLIQFGLVVCTMKGGTRGYKVTDDGLLYIDGMFGRRDCSEHPNQWAELMAVSRGRTISLNANELAVLAAIFLGEQLTSHVIDCAEKMGFEKWINGTLFDLAGSLAHGVRHSKRGEQKVEFSLARSG